VAAAPIPFVVSTLRAHTRAGDRILDVGCGHAHYRHATDAEYVGLDVTDAPYAAGLPRDVDVVASAEQMPLDDASFDLVYSLSAFYQVPDTQRALSEMRRVLRPGGRLVLFDYNRRTQRSLSAAEGAPRPCWTQWGLRRHVRGAGFEQVRLLVADTTQPPRPRRWLRLLDEELRGQWAIVTAIAPRSAAPVVGGGGRRVSSLGAGRREQRSGVGDAARNQAARHGTHDDRKSDVQHGAGEGER
jgi:SAM-dependent methyltransferase